MAALEVEWYRQGVNLVPVDEVYYSVYYASSYVVEGEKVPAVNVVAMYSRCLTDVAAWSSKVQGRYEGRSPDRRHRHHKGSR